MSHGLFLKDLVKLAYRQKHQGKKPEVVPKSCLSDQVNKHMHTEITGSGSESSPAPPSLHRAPLSQIRQNYYFCNPLDYSEQPKMF